MTQEFMWLTLTVILTMVLWIPYTLDRIRVRGLMGAMANPSRDDKPQSPWAQRLYFAHTNAVDNRHGARLGFLRTHLNADGHAAPLPRKKTGTSRRTCVEVKSYADARRAR